MPTKLTKRTVDAAQAGPADRFVWDADVPGFGLKITPAGKKLYILQYRLGGRGTPTRRYTIGEHGADYTPDKARGIAIRLRGKIKEGIDPQAEKKAQREAKPKPETFAETLDRYLRHMEQNLRPSTYKECKRLLEHDAKAKWGKRATESITRRDVRELLDDIAKRDARVHSNRTRTRLLHLFDWAVKRDIIAASPVAGIDPLAREKERDRVLSVDEIRWFWTGCNQLGSPFGPLFKLLLLTAQRRDEVGRMEWAEIDLEKRVWIIPREKAKNDREHEVALSDPAIEILEAIKEENSKLDDLKNSPFVFTTNGKTPVSGFSRAKERLDAKMERQARNAAGLPEEDERYREALKLDPEDELPMQMPEWILHDLRRTAATGMAKLGIPPHVVDRVLNHVSGTIRGVAAIYNRHSYSEERAKALEAWTRHVETLIRPAESNVVPIRA